MHWHGAREKRIQDYTKEDFETISDYDSFNPITPLHYICDDRSLDCSPGGKLDILLKSPYSDFNKPCPDNKTPFYWLCWNSRYTHFVHNGLLKYMIDHKNVDLNLCDSQNRVIINILCSQSGDNYLIGSKMLKHIIDNTNANFEICKYNANWTAFWSLCCESEKNKFIESGMFQYMIDKKKITSVPYVAFFHLCVIEQRTGRNAFATSDVLQYILQHGLVTDETIKKCENSMSPLMKTIINQSGIIHLDP